MTPEDSGSGTLTVGQAANAFEGLMDTPANSDEQLASEQLTEEQAQEQEAEPQQEEEVVFYNSNSYFVIKSNNNMRASFSFFFFFFRLSFANRSYLILHGKESVCIYI